MKKKMQGQKGKCKDDIKSYSLDRFEQVERSKKLKRVLSPSIETSMPRPIAHHGLLKCKNLCCCQVMPMGRSKLPRTRTSACCCVVFLYGNLGMLEILSNLLP